jgi:transglutaminase-like putative cysteine protease
MDQLGTNGDGRYQVVTEPQILQAIVLYCWPFEARGENSREAARRAGEALERWVARGLPFRESQGQRYFDFCQVVNFMRWTADVQGDRVYEDNMIAAWRRSLDRMVGAGWIHGDATAELPLRRLVVTLRREFNLAGIEPGTPVRLRLPLPYEDETQSGIVVEEIDTGAADGRVRRQPGRLEVRRLAPARPEPVAIAVRISFITSPRPGLLDPNCLEDWDRQDPEYRLYTRSAEGLIQITETVTRLAADLAGDAADPWQAVQAFWGFFFARMKPGHVHHDELDAGDPLGSLVRRGWFDCYTGSALLAALCRSRGIPARLVHGILPYPSATHHYWTEILMPPYGWVPADLGSCILAAGRLDNPPWSRLFLGRLDYRMKTECHPHLVVGNPGVRFSQAWYVVQRIADSGTETAFHNLAGGQLLYRDWIRVED